MRLVFHERSEMKSDGRINPGELSESGHSNSLSNIKTLKREAWNAKHGTRSMEREAWNAKHET